MSEITKNVELCQSYASNTSGSILCRTHIYNSYHVLLHLHMTSISDRGIGRRVVSGRPRNEVSSRFIEWVIYRNP